jgi:hypothetical protein
MPDTAAGSLTGTEDEVIAKLEKKLTESKNSLRGRCNVRVTSPGMQAGPAFLSCEEALD